MCGICGVVGGDSTVEARWVRAMTTAIAHRGPDDEGVQVDHPAVLGNRRLAILDLSPAGHQPLGGDALGAWITYNGEIYNHAALRSELTAAGHQFHGTSDTEVVLAMYREHGPSFVSRLRGMFALAIWDRRRQRLFCARDHFGQKPFFYTEIGGRLLFASEIKALLAHPDVTREPEPAAIDYYLSLRMIPPPLTMFRGIRKLPAGHWLQWSADEGVATGAYWVPTPPASVPRSDGEWVDAIRGALTGAVESHRVSDVQVGAYLSGGLDSSVVVALLSRHGQERIPTFCVGSASPTFDERPQARIVASHCRTDHHESVASVALLHELPHLVGALDEPSDPIAACFDAAARLAATHVKVVLGGDGGDEIFGGFDRYAAFNMANRYAALPRWLREDLIRPLVRAVPEGIGYKTLAQRARWLDEVTTERGGRLYARMTSYFRFSPERKADLYGPVLHDALAGADALSAIARPFEALKGASPLDRMLHADLVTRLPEHTLMLADRLAMSHGLEVRSPLLDLELAELALGMPVHLRVNRGQTKVALRAAARPWLPSAILARGKQGFMFPVAEWLDGGALAKVSSHLLEGPLVREGWIRAEAVRAMAAEHERRRVDHHVRLWQLLSLDSWYRLFLEGESPAAQVVRMTRDDGGRSGAPATSPGEHA
jgi:asparagine synthase (glutamine-hydrolysing)